jgi:hypothetical protein
LNGLSRRSTELPSAREFAREIARRVAARAGRLDAGEGVSYVVRLSNPITALDRLQLAAARLERTPVAIMPHRCKTPEEWLARYAQIGRQQKPAPWATVAYTCEHSD